MNRVMILTSPVQHPRGGSPRPGVRFGACLAVLALSLATRSTSPVAAAQPPRGNFVVHAASPRAAKMIAEHAEHVRSRIFATILGADQAARWSPACEIHVHATAASFTAAVGGPPAAARGDMATLLRFLEECREGGVEPALARHYRISSVAALEAAWETPTPILEPPLLVDRGE